MPTVMIISGESSGELYGSLLAKALKNRLPDIHIIGIGGERMEEAGVELVSHIASAFGLIEAVSALNKIKTAFNNAVGALKKFKPEVLVLIDYPDFNLRVAKAAKSLGIKILYYVSPQVWAWRKGRVKKIANIVDRMAVILPFEEEIYRKAGVACEFVGHPIVEEIEAILESTEVFSGQHLLFSKKLRTFIKSALGLNPNKALLSLLPGSRPHELDKLLPLMVEVVKEFKNDADLRQGHDYQFCMPLAPNTDAKKYNRYINILRQEGVVIREGESVKVLAASDLAVVASGTATLQTAFLEVPMVVVYKLSPMTYHIGKRIIKVKHISLVNILSGKEVVVELLQERANPEEVMNELKKIMLDTKYRENMIDSYRKIKGPFTGKKTSERVTEIVMEMAGWK